MSKPKLTEYRKDVTGSLCRFVIGFEKAIQQVILVCHPDDYGLVNWIVYPGPDDAEQAAKGTRVGRDVDGACRDADAAASQLYDVPDDLGLTASMHGRFVPEDDNRPQWKKDGFDSQEQYDRYKKYLEE